MPSLAFSIPNRPPPFSVEVSEWMLFLGHSRFLGRGPFCPPIAEVLLPHLCLTAPPAATHSSQGLSSVRSCRPGRAKGLNGFGPLSPRRPPLIVSPSNSSLPSSHPFLFPSPPPVGLLAPSPFSPYSRKTSISPHTSFSFFPSGSFLSLSYVFPFPALAPSFFFQPHG